jgi:hypothetical protein
VGGVGSGSWYRFNKKTTTDECQGIDVRYLHRNGLLQPERSFSLRWSRAGRHTGSIRGVTHDDDRVAFCYRHSRGSGGDWEDVKQTVPLEWTPCNLGGEALVHMSWSGMRPEGCGSLRAGALFPVPVLPRPPLREPARGPDA